MQLLSNARSHPCEVAGTYCSIKYKLPTARLSLGSLLCTPCPLLPNPIPDYCTGHCWGHSQDTAPHSSLQGEGCRWAAFPPVNSCAGSLRGHSFGQQLARSMRSLLPGSEHTMYINNFLKKMELKDKACFHTKFKAHEQFFYNIHFPQSL